MLLIHVLAFISLMNFRFLDFAFSQGYFNDTYQNSWQVPICINCAYLHYSYVLYATITLINTSLKILPATLV